MNPYPTIITLTPEQCRALIADVVAEQLKSFAHGLRPDSQGAEYLSTKETLALLHITKPTLNKLRDKGAIHSYQCSDKRVLYRRQELTEYLQASKQKGALSIC